MHIHGHGTGCMRQGGFTVLELMITLTIAVILLTAAAPSFRQISQKRQLSAALSGLHYDLVMGRNEAVFRNESTVACPGSPAGGCAGSTDWSSGWIVFLDRNGDQQRESDEIMLRHGQNFGNLRILGSAGRRDIRFLPDGSTPGSNTTITFCGLGGPAQARKLVISNLGRIRRDSAADLDPDRCPSA